MRNRAIPKNLGWMVVSTPQRQGNFKNIEPWGAWNQGTSNKWRDIMVCTPPYSGDITFYNPCKWKAIILSSYRPRPSPLTSLPFRFSTTPYSGSCETDAPSVNVSLCFNWAPRHEGVLGEWRYSSTYSLTLVLDGGEWSASRPGRFTPRKRASLQWHSILK
jgi:hypothetical protein